MSLKMFLFKVFFFCCACVCVWSRCVWCICTCAEASGACQVSFFVIFCLIPLRQGLSLGLDPGWLPTSPRDSHLKPHSVGVAGKWLRPAFYVGIGDSNSDPHACAADTFAHRAITQPLSYNSPDEIWVNQAEHTC